MLALEAGTYDLAWQVDSTLDVPGYIGGASRDGFRVPAAFGAFPASLNEGTGGFAITDETWATFVSWIPRPEIIEVRRGTGTITLVWTSCPALGYHVQRSADLLSWTASPLIIATGPTTEWTDAVPPGASRHFYRLAMP